MPYALLGCVVVDGLWDTWHRRTGSCKHELLGEQTAGFAYGVGLRVQVGYVVLYFVSV